MPPQLEKQLKVWHFIVGLAVTVACSGFAWGIAWGQNMSSVEKIMEQAKANEARITHSEGVIHSIEVLTSETRNDVKWIKEAIQGYKKQ